MFRWCRPQRYLSDAQALSLTKVLYAEHYARKDADNQVKAEVDMTRWYAARTELRWLRDFVETKIDANRPAERLKLLNYLVLQRVDLHKPLSYIIGSQPFIDCDILCEEPILIPRPETEQWVNWLKRKTSMQVSPERPCRILDLCCGTGCIGVALAKGLPSCEVVAVDAELKATELTAQNYRRNGIPEDKFTLLHGDMFTPLSATQAHAFDLIVSNPPYIFADDFNSLPRTVARWESRLALVGDARHEQDPLSYYREICTGAHKWLKPAPLKPCLVVEVGMQAPQVAEMFEADPAWSEVELHEDWNGEMRWVACQLRTSDQASHA